jgi:hypothetical protein
LAEQFLVELEETRLANGMFRWAPKDIEKPRSLTPVEKAALEAKHALLAQKAESRQEECWRYDCTRKASIWVREVGYDFKGEKADPVQHVAVSSSDYDGPVPGFCTFCLGSGPEEMAQEIYFSRPEMYWGVRPNRWFVTFTDGTRQGGMVIALDPKTQTLPTIIEEHISGNH